jgi:hypothetical protein
MKIKNILKILIPLALATSSAFAQTADTTSVDYRGADTVKVDDLSIIIDYRYTSENGIKKFYLNKFRCDEFDKLKKSIKHGLDFPEFYYELTSNFIITNPCKVFENNGEPFSFTIEKSLCWSCNDAEKAIVPCGENQSLPQNFHVKYLPDGKPSCSWEFSMCYNDSRVPCVAQNTNNCFTSFKLSMYQTAQEAAAPKSPYGNYTGR